MAATDWKEEISDGEPAQLEALAETLLAIQKTNGGRWRALHAKANAGVSAELTVPDGLSDEARVGIFAKPGSYRGWVRFSNGTGRRQSDRRGDVRGIALKLVGVPGKKLIPGMEDAVTQDFLMIRTAKIPFRNSDEFVWLVTAAQSPATLVPKLLFRFGLGRGLRILKELKSDLGRPTPSLAATTYFTALPLRFGDRACKLSLLAQEKSDGQNGRTPEFLHEELAARLQKGPVHYDLRVQFFADEKSTPIEDASVEWQTPWVTIGKLALPQQEMDSPAGRALAERIETFSFDPWHAPIEFRPLGNMMRARNHSYRLSTQERGAAGEPTAFE
jgi:hypothetical protein